MRFTPNTRILCFQSGELTDAFSWMRQAFPVDPVQDLLIALPVSGDIEEPPMAQGQEPLRQGPIQPCGTCPVTGRALRLHIFRDMSAVILRETDQGYEALPATLAVRSEINDISLKETPFLERSGVPLLRLQARPDGLRWDARLTEVTAEELLGMLAEEISSKAASILRAEPVADPRVHTRIPEGARYVPFSRWPGVERRSEAVERLARIVEALARLRAERTGDQFISIDLRRRMPPEPWRQKNLGGTAVSQRTWGLGRAGRRDKTFDKALRGLLSSRYACLPDALCFGPDDRLVYLTDIGPAGSSHAALACIEVLRDIAPEIDITPFLSREEAK